MKKLIIALASFVLLAGIPALAFASISEDAALAQHQGVRNDVASLDGASGSAERVSKVAAESPVIAWTQNDTAGDATASTDALVSDGSADTPSTTVSGRILGNAARGGNYVDADGNGICDNYENGTCPGGNCPNGYDRPCGNGAPQGDRVCDGTGRGARSGASAAGGAQGSGRGYHGGR